MINSAEDVPPQEPIDPVADRAALVLIAATYDREILGEDSRSYLDSLAADIDQLPLEPAAKAVETSWLRLADVIHQLGLRQTSQMLERLQAYLGANPGKRDVFERAWDRVCRVHGPKAEASISRMHSEGLDPATGEPKAPGWLDLSWPGQFPHMAALNERLDRYDAAMEAFSKSWWAKENAAQTADH